MEENVIRKDKEAKPKSNKSPHRRRSVNKTTSYQRASQANEQRPSSGTKKKGPTDNTEL